MPNIKSAIKRTKQTQAKNARNRAARSVVSGAVKKVRLAVSANDLTGAKAQLVVAFKELDQAAAAGIIHANKASNQKSRLSTLINKLETGKITFAQKVDNKTRVAAKKAAEAAKSEEIKKAAEAAKAEKVAAAKPVKKAKTEKVAAEDASEKPKRATKKKVVTE